MIGKKPAKTKNKKPTTRPPFFRNKLSGRNSMPYSYLHDADITTPEFGHNFSEVYAGTSPFQQSCSLSLPGPSYCPYGGACHVCPPRIQAKLKIGRSGDKFEQEADRNTEKVMRMPEPQPGGSEQLSGKTQTNQIQRMCTNCEEEEEKVLLKPLNNSATQLIQRQIEEEEDVEEELLQAKELPNQTLNISPQVYKQINNMRGEGNPLPESARAFFEPRFGYDFSNVNLHTDSRASETAKAINAKAFTIGQDVIFGAGQYNPDSTSSKHLLAHELTHVVQQNQHLPVTTENQHFINEKRNTFDNHNSFITNKETIQRKEFAGTGPEPDTIDDISAPALIVEDKTEAPGPGQMKKSEFLAELRPRVCQTVESIIARVGRTTDDCPYLEFVFKFLGLSSAQYIDKTIKRFVPNAEGAISARDYIPIIIERVRQSAESWVNTGEITGLPEGIPTNLRDAALSEGSEESPASTDNVLFKNKPGGSRIESNPGEIRAQLGDGRPIDSSVKSRMTSAFGHDFSKVRIHTDSEATSLSNRQNARAFTVGNHIAFGAGEYQPGTLIGDALIAHELAHVSQQEGDKTDNFPKQVKKASYNALEEDADFSAVSAAVSLWSGAKTSLKNLTKNAMPRLKTGLRLQSCQRTVKKCPPGKSWQVRTNLGKPLAVGTGPVCWCVWRCRPAPPAPPPPNSVSCARDPRTGRSLCSGPPPVEEKDWPEQRQKAGKQPTWKLGPGGHFTPLTGQAKCGCIPLDVEGGEKTGAPLIDVGLQATDLAGIRGRPSRDSRTGVISPGSKSRQTPKTTKPKPAITQPAGPPKSIPKPSTPKKSGIPKQTSPPGAGAAEKSHAAPIPKGGISVQERIKQGGRPRKNVKDNPDKYYYDPKAKRYFPRSVPSIAGTGKATGPKNNPNPGWGPGQIPCFSSDTLVSTTDGLRMINSINIGETVYAYDFLSQKSVVCKILNVFKGNTDCWVDVHFKSDVLRTTRRHPLWIESDQSWVEAQDLAPGMRVLKKDGGTSEVRFVELLPQDTMQRTYNLNVDVANNFFAGKLEFLVHNDDTSLGETGHRNYYLKNKSGEIYYEGRFGPRETAASVAGRHAKTPPGGQPNEFRFNKALGDEIVVLPGTRTKGEAMRMEHERSVRNKTMKGKTTWRGNRIWPMDSQKFPKHYAKNAC